MTSFAATNRPGGSRQGPACRRRRMAHAQSGILARAPASRTLRRLGQRSCPRASAAGRGRCARLQPLRLRSQAAIDGTPPRAARKDLADDEHLVAAACDRPCPPPSRRRPRRTSRWRRSASCRGRGRGGARTSVSAAGIPSRGRCRGRAPVPPRGRQRGQGSVAIVLRPGDGRSVCNWCHPAEQNRARGPCTPPRESATSVFTNRDRRRRRRTG